MSPRRTTAGSQPRSAETGALPRHEACHWLGAAPTPRLSQIAHVERRDHRRHARSSSKAVTPSRTGSGPRRRWNRTNPVTRGPVAVGCRDRAGAGSRTGSSMRTTGRLPRQNGFVRPTSRPSERRRSARRLWGRSRGESDRERVARSPRKGGWLSSVAGCSCWRQCRTYRWRQFGPGRYAGTLTVTAAFGRLLQHQRATPRPPRRVA